MTAQVDPNGPKLTAIPSNPVPEGARVGYFTTPDRVRLRYALWPKGQGAPKGSVCLVQGRTEYIEKYFETIEDFRQRGFAVATFDWRGQGGSDRLIGNRELGYVDRFDDYWTDLRSFHADILLPDCPGPYYLVGHSMGGLASLYAATRDRMMFDRVFLSTPMVGLHGMEQSLPRWALFAETASFLGLGRLPMARRGDRRPDEAMYPDNPLTSDMLRYKRMVETIRADDGLYLGSPTFRWLAAALRAMVEAGKDSFPGQLKIPLLMLAAARDRVVSTPNIESLGLRLRTGRHMVIAGARHELFMESDAIRGQVLAAFDAFITEQS
ncbi:alpha/beta hydrolase [Devosia sp. YIM 151766]|uniref:alpha/beta fold hydrolase n=1 Tax=Devosia sp. YIM 151766 TaxID=3017325 RepID=UPI00255CAB77|nr:alpha/beta hydrolase [Devosia sp. YIM 151766]WIY52399.1 alpha/beta hydrolase [Devosia sp. YIM 151766]